MIVLMDKEAMGVTRSPIFIAFTVAPSSFQTGCSLSDTWLLKRSTSPARYSHFAVILLNAI
ncbi:hypothetical protein BDW69DRAFT_163202 [Aspergillus filifer]